MLFAVKFIDGSDDVIEGLILPYGGPMGGKDLTGTFFTKETDFCLDWFPEGGRPGLYRHGFDPTTKQDVIGREIGGRDDERGHWLQAQLDASYAYAEQIKELVRQGKLFLSSGAVDHLTEVKESTGEILRWPWIEWSLTPKPANPDQPAVREHGRELPGYAVKSFDAIEHLRVLGVAIPAAVKGWMPDGTTPAMLDDGDFAWLSAKYKAGDESKTDGRKYPYRIHGRVDPDGWRAAWSFIAKADDAQFDGGPSKAATIKKLLADKPKGINVAKKDSEAAWDASTGASTLSNLLALLGDEADEADQAAMLRVCIDALQRWITAETAEIGTSADTGAFLEVHGAVREGKRNSASDAGLLAGAHDNIATVLGLDCMPGSAAKSLDAEPPRGLAIRVSTGPEPMSAEQVEQLKQRLAGVAVTAAREVLGRT
jgi:hypothetical protein